MNPTVKIPRQQIELELNVFRAKRELQKSVMEASRRKAMAERLLVTRFLETQGILAPENQSMSLARAAYKQWCSAHEADADAQYGAAETSLREIEAQIAIRENILKQSDSPILNPGSVRF